MSQTPGTSSSEGKRTDAVATPPTGSASNGNAAFPVAVAAPPSATGSAPAIGAADAAKGRELFQAIASDFYNVSDSEGRPIAGLLVLMDSKRRPVRAELHLGGSTTEEGGRHAIRQAQRILEGQYVGPESVPLQVWQSFLRSEPLHVPLPPAGTGAPRSATAVAASDEGVAIPWKPILMGLGALLVVALLWWAISALRGGSDTPSTEPRSGGIAVPGADDTAGTTDLTDGLAPDSGDITVVDGDVVLPPSTLAPPDILPGRRVRMVPGLTQSVLDRPGTAVGTEIARIGADRSVMVVGGPELLPGQSDTIVWLEVDLGDDVTGWVAANNSTQALLELAD